MDSLDCRKRPWIKHTCIIHTIHREKEGRSMEKWERQREGKREKGREKGRGKGREHLRKLVV